MPERVDRARLAGEVVETVDGRPPGTGDPPGAAHVHEALTAPDVSIETLLLQALGDDGAAGVTPAIHQTSLFTFESFQQMRSTLDGKERRYVYTRGRNPTVEAFERLIAQMERAEEAVAFASGMAAISAVVLGSVRAGDRIVCVRNVYPDAHRLMTQLLPRFGVGVEFVNGTDTDAVLAAVAGDGSPARLLYLESPTSQLLELQDLAPLASGAREFGTQTVLDNSWATPLGQRPLDAGIDLVIHSASKYLSGHSDVVAGVIAGSAELIEDIRRSELMMLGGKLSPLEAWLLVRGIRTLPVRLERHARSALELARFLESSSEVRSVNYPALETHPQHDLFRRYFRQGSGLLSFELQEERMVEPFIDALQLFRLGVSWGGFESLVYPSLLGHLTGSESSSTRFFDVPRALVRLHVGLEDPADLRADLSRAFAAATKGGT